MLEAARSGTEAHYEHALPEEALRGMKQIEVKVMAEKVTWTSFCRVPYSSGKNIDNTCKILVRMHDYDSQKWYDLYRTAVLEFERAAITGRIRDARAEITTRVEALRQHPGLHHAELLGIEDALNNLRVLEREEERLAAEDKKRILEQTMQRLKNIAPKFAVPEQQ